MIVYPQLRHNNMIESLKTFLALTPEELAQPVILKQKQDVFYLLLNTKANAFSKDFVRAIQAKINEVEAYDGPTALVTVSLSKMYSGGLDLKYVTNLHVEDRRYFVLEFIALLGRISVLPFPTFTLVRGGAVAGGCMLAFAHDYIYTAGKSMFSANEAANGMYLPPGMMAVFKKRHSLPGSFRDMVMISKQFSGEEALAAKFIDGQFKEEEAVSSIHALANDLSYLGENKTNMKKIKTEMYRDVVDACFNRQHATGTVGEAKMTEFPKL